MQRWDNPEHDPVPTANDFHDTTTGPAPAETAPEEAAPDLTVLLRRAATGDVGAMDVFYDLTCPLAYGLACSLLGIGRDAQSLLGAAYLAAWRTLRTAPPAPGSESLWLLAKVLAEHQGPPARQVF